MMENVLIEMLESIVKKGKKRVRAFILLMSKRDGNKSIDTSVNIFLVVRLSMPESSSRCSRVTL